MTNRERDPFADDVLERLARSHQKYQREHGHYIVPLAERLLAARAECERLRAVVQAYRVLHAATCDDYWADDECACGGRQLLAALEQRRG